MRRTEFSKTIGHEKQKRLFLEAIKTGTLGHAYALVGPENTGKTTFALELAELFGAHPIMDVVLFDSDDEFGIEEARRLQHRLSLTPGGNLKVGIVAHAERMTLPAANSLLKTLEEPPAHSLLFLITTNFCKLLPTIVSRLQRMNFSLNSEAEVETGLRGFSLNAAELSQISQLAFGRIGLARQLASSPSLMDYYRQGEKYYRMLSEGTMVERLQSASALAGREPNEVSLFLKFAMQRWIEAGGETKIARKLQDAFKELAFNLNAKLVLDTLFLPDY